MFHRFLERLDEVGSTLVPLAYLSGLFLGTASYFAGVRGWGLAVAVGIGLAAGSELHSFLQQRRSRASYGEYRRIRRAGGDARDAREVFRLNVGILAGLVVFQCITATAFAAQNWPVSGPPLAAWAQYLLRGCVVPVLFLLSGLLLPLTQSAAAVLTRASDDILHTAVSRNVRYWRRRIKRASRRGADLSPLMVALLTDAGEDAAARRTSLIADNLTLAEAHMRPAWYARWFARPAPDTFAGALLPAPAPVTPDPLPPEGGPGTPLVVRHARTPRADVLRLVADTPYRPGESKEAQARAAWRPGMSVVELQAAAGIARGTAQKYAAQFAAEDASAHDRATAHATRRAQ